MITPPVKTECAAERAEADPFALAICAIADLAAYAQRQRLTMADELLLELLAFLFVAQPASSGVKLLAGGDSATPDMQGLLQLAPGGDATFVVDQGKWPGGSRH